MGRALSYDVVVAGGGTAGLAAAVAASRAGAQTALVERYGFLGGTATASLLGTICGLYLGSRSGEPEHLNLGFPAELAEQLAALPGCAPPVRMGRVFVLPYAPPAFAFLADRITGQARGLDVLFHEVAVAAEGSTSRIEAVRVAGPSGYRELQGRAFVDCTGDAILSRLAGVPIEETQGTTRQPPAIVFVLQGVEEPALRPATVAILRALVQAERAGQLPTGCSHLALRPSGRPGEIVAKLTLTGLGEGPFDWAAAEREGRRRATAVAAFLSERVAGFDRSFVSHTAPQVGVREGATVVGAYRLTREDVLEGRRFEDGVARGAWPIEIWEEGRSGARFEYLEDGASYDIPLRCLRSVDSDNLFVAGRCLSATPEALASARVMGTCLATGEAAGRAAARRAEGHG